AGVYERHAPAYLVEQIGIDTAAAPHLTHHVVAAIRVLERHVPGLHDLVKPDRPAGAVATFDPLRAVVRLPPVPHEDVALRGGGPALVEGGEHLRADLAADLLPLGDCPAPGGDHP